MVRYVYLTNPVAGAVLIHYFESMNLFRTPSVPNHKNKGTGTVCSEYSNIFKYLLTNIFIRLSICGFFQSKYIWTFIQDFFSPPEYIRIFICNVRFQGMHSNKAAYQNFSCYSKTFRQFDISAIDIKIISLVLVPFLIFTIQLYSFTIIFGQYFLF